jgi:putative transposase
MPNPKAQPVVLSEQERQALEKLVKRHQTAQQIALRARIVLAAAEGKPSVEIARKEQVTHDTVRLWRNRWVKLQDISLDDLSLEERLADAPRPGAPAGSRQTNAVGSRRWLAKSRKDQVGPSRIGRRAKSPMK